MWFFCLCQAHEQEIVLQPPRCPEIDEICPLGKFQSFAEAHDELQPCEGGDPVWSGAIAAGKAQLRKQCEARRWNLHPLIAAF